MLCFPSPCVFFSISKVMFRFPSPCAFFRFFSQHVHCSSKATFFFLPLFEDDALVLLFSKCRTEMTEMPNEKLKVMLCFPSLCAFFRFFFTAFSLFLLKLSFLSKKVSIFISKLHECVSVSLSMCFFFLFFSLHVRCFF
ncbi:hypothetical protein AAZX31_11G165100 [Glycine max]